ncbi:MAG: hypothetical protein MUF83_11955 [Acidimicrobiales bacterium]|jgi:hypothetical protein|nr:hypothetical protein [Acidimicrobiales bacterium]
MDRPKKFHDTRWLGDKRAQVVYDVDNLDDADAPLVEDVIANEAGLCFGPDTLVEARNRGYKPFKGNGSGKADVDVA